jgi:hypothetical protein
LFKGGRLFDSGRQANAWAVQRMGGPTHGRWGATCARRVGEADQIELRNNGAENNIRPRIIPQGSICQELTARMRGNIDRENALLRRILNALTPKGNVLMLPNWPHARRQAVMATIIPWNGRLGVSYTYGNGDAEAGPIGPEDGYLVLERDGKISFTSQRVRERFTKLRQLGPTAD